MVRGVQPQTTSHRSAGWALFLDVDGTLLEIADTPQDVSVPASLKRLLIELRRDLDGALAFVSGRTLEDLDRLFSPLRPCASGMHGSERRDAAGDTTRPEIDLGPLDAARHELARFVRDRPGLLLEDKRYGFAVHFRLAPLLGGEVESVMLPIAESIGPEFMLQAGKCVLEIRPAACSKGTSVAAFMREPPFAGRVPIYIGDDVTDESAFVAVNSFGGISIRVGEEAATAAHYRLSGVGEVLRWLEDLQNLEPASRASR
jgi:trehalose 6-phosphate phosphatase